MTHLIKHLSFGKDYPGIVNPLDGTDVTAPQGQRHHGVCFLYDTSRNRNNTCSIEKALKPVKLHLSFKLHFAHVIISSCFCGCKRTAAAHKLLLCLLHTRGRLLWLPAEIVPEKQIFIIDFTAFIIQVLTCNSVFGIWLNHPQTFRFKIFFIRPSK